MVLGLDFIPGLDLFEIVLFIVEWLPYIVATNIILLTLVKPNLRKYLICFIPLFIVTAVSVVVLSSYEHASKAGYDLSQPTIRSALELYIKEGKGNLNDILYSKKFSPTFGQHELKYLLTDLMTHTLFHLDTHNEMNIPVSYNKGNDWFRATLGEPMVYTSGIYKTGNESLMEAQMYKLDYVANAIDLKAGEDVLDIGCGWSTLVRVFSTKYDANVIGVTLSSSQIDYFNENVKPKLPKHSKSKVILQDAMKMLDNPLIKGKKFDKIVALEMAEHVGIRRYDEFLRIVKSLLKDDGVFYIQVAGLKRAWKYEDLVWGLFMGEHVFPGADASCPIGWVSTHLERAGFEVQRVSNLGSHYSRTLSQWLDEWHLAKDPIAKKYGVEAYRRWEVFLAWSVKIAKQGSSTVFMITNTKQNVDDGSFRTAVQKRLVPTF